MGNSGSGKSTLAKKLGQRLNMPVYHLDKELLVGDYQKLPNVKRIAKHGLLINKPSWIIDGNYSKDLEPRFKKADLVIFISTSRLIVFPRILKRAIFKGQDKDTVPLSANHQLLTWNFLKFVAKYNRRKRLKIIRELCKQADTKLLIIKNQPVEKMANRVTDYIQQNF